MSRKDFSDSIPRLRTPVLIGRNMVVMWVLAVAAFTAIVKPGEVTGQQRNQSFAFSQFTPGGGSNFSISNSNHTNISNLTTLTNASISVEQPSYEEALLSRQVDDLIAELANTNLPLITRGAHLDTATFWSMSKGLPSDSYVWLLLTQ
jgi:hypothetical protein